MKIELRDYQEKARDATLAALQARKNPLCVLPTGAGKSLVLAAILRAQNEPSLVLSHVKELLEQDAVALARMAPEIEQGFFVAGLNEKDHRSQVIFGSVQSVYRSLVSFREPRQLFIDEAHLCPRKADAMYATVFDHFSATQRAGLTATASRMDSGSLVTGDGAWFDCIAHDEDVRELIKRGFLVPLVGVMPKLQVDLAGVGSRAGEFMQEAMQEAVMKTLSLPEAIKSAKELAVGRRAWLVFAAGIEHARKVVEALRAQSVSAESVTQETSSADRRDIIARFKRGEFRALVNVGVLTTGFDAPITDCIVSLRPTKSSVLWPQMLGRGMRLAQGKSDCLLLDFVGNLDRLGGVGVVQEMRDYRVLPPGQKRKPRLSVVQRAAEPELREASTIDPMMTGRSFTAAVNDLSYFTMRSHKYPGKSVLIAVYELQDELGRALTARHWICIEYDGAARRHAQRFFTRRGLPRERIPESAQSCLLYARALPRPSEVVTRYERSMKSFVIDNEVFAEEPQQVDGPPL